MRVTQWLCSADSFRKLRCSGRSEFSRPKSCPKSPRLNIMTSIRAAIWSTGIAALRMHWYGNRAAFELGLRSYLVPVSTQHACWRMGRLASQSESWTIQTKQSHTNSDSFLVNAPMLESLGTVQSVLSVCATCTCAYISTCLCHAYVRAPIYRPCTHACVYVGSKKMNCLSECV